jgi:hypothetical protein
VNDFSLSNRIDKILLSQIALRNDLTSLSKELKEDMRDFKDQVRGDIRFLRIDVRDFKDDVRDDIKVLRTQIKVLEEGMESMKPVVDILKADVKEIKADVKKISVSNARTETKANFLTGIHTFTMFATLALTTIIAVRFKYLYVEFPDGW